MSLAWVLRPSADVDLEEHGCEVVFADDEAGARRQASEPEYYTVTRAPHFDVHAPGPVPSDVLLAAGWGLPCWWCDHMLDQDGCEECAELAGADFTAPPVTAGVRAWCSTDCRDRYVSPDARWARGGR